MDYNSIRKYKLQAFFSKIYTAYIVSMGCMVYVEISATAASLDRIEIRGGRQEMICADRDRERLIEELVKCNPADKGMKREREKKF